MKFKPLAASWKITIGAGSLLVIAAITFVSFYYYNNIYYTTIIPEFGSINVIYTTSTVGNDGSQKQFLYKCVQKVRYRDGVLKLFDYRGHEADNSPDFVVNNVTSYKIDPELDNEMKEFPKYQSIDIEKTKQENERARQEQVRQQRDKPSGLENYVKSLQSWQ